MRGMRHDLCGRSAEAPPPLARSLFMKWKFICSAGEEALSPESPAPLTCRRRLARQITAAAAVGRFSHCPLFRATQVCKCRFLHSKIHLINCWVRATTHSHQKWEYLWSFAPPAKQAYHRFVPNIKRPTSANDTPASYTCNWFANCYLKTFVK